MSKRQWAQHRSGHGQKWEILCVEHCQGSTWRVESNTPEGYIDLPKSEYRLCAPPEEWEDVEEWVDVTVGCTARVWKQVGPIGPTNGYWRDGDFFLANGGFIVRSDAYRVRKVLVRTADPGCQLVWAFTVERNNRMKP